LGDSYLGPLRASSVFSDLLEAGPTFREFYLCSVAPSTLCKPFLNLFQPLSKLFGLPIHENDTGGFLCHDIVSESGKTII
jgi:hypothetical protein